jgi:hypothetical protein
MKAVAEENEGRKVTDGFHLKIFKGMQQMLFLPL